MTVLSGGEKKPLNHLKQTEVSCKEWLLALKELGIQINYIDIYFFTHPHVYILLLLPFFLNKHY